MARLRLRADRVADLMAALEGELRALAQAEREFAAVRGGDVDELAREQIASARRVGLPVAEFRGVAAVVRKARREVVRGREEMVRAHLPLVVAIAKKYRRNGAMDLLDLIQEGNMGLMHAIEKFDHRRGVKVSTYAVWWIRQSIARAIAEQSRTIRIPVHMTEIAARVLRDRRKLYQEKGREPAAADIARRTGIAIARIEQVLSMVQQPTSLDLPIGEDGDAVLGDLIAAPDAIDPHSAAEVERPQGRRAGGDLRPDPARGAHPAHAVRHRRDGRAHPRGGRPDLRRDPRAHPPDRGARPDEAARGEPGRPPRRLRARLSVQAHCQRSPLPAWGSGSAGTVLC